MIPSDVQEFKTDGEKLFYRFMQLIAKPNEHYIAWYLPQIKNREPDFILYSAKVGLVVFEVKDWALDQIIYADPHKIILKRGGKEESNKNPFQQAREYCNTLMDRIKEDQYLLSKEPEYFGKLRIPINSGAVFPNINKYEFQSKFKDKAHKDILDVDKIFFWDDFQPESPLCKDPTGHCFSETLLGKFPALFPFQLTVNEVNHLRKLIFPMIIIVLPERKLPEGLNKHVEKIKMLDHHQEAIARKFDSGHHIIIGPSGSGKTLILVHKAGFLQQYNASIKRILFVCFNITLVNYIKRLLANKKVPLGEGGVEVLHFYELCSKILGEEIHYEKEDLAYYQTVTGLTQDKLRELSLQYDAILIDEGQDFSDDMYNVITSLLNKKTNNLTIALDERQTIYTNRQSWKELGIQAKGRVHRISNIYRNTEEITSFAKKFKGLNDISEKNQMQPELFDHFFEYHGPRPEIKGFSSYEDIALFVADRIKKLHSEDEYPFSDIAIIYSVRSSDGVADTMPIPRIFQTELESKGIMSNWVSEDYRSKKSYDITTNSVTISTIHSSKGLDYACVFLVGLDLLKSGDQWSEEQINSLAYVGLTRARYNLFIPYAKETPLIAKLRSSL